MFFVFYDFITFLSVFPFYPSLKYYLKFAYHLWRVTGWRQPWGWGITRWGSPATLPSSSSCYSSSSSSSPQSLNSQHVVFTHRYEAFYNTVCTRGVGWLAFSEHPLPNFLCSPDLSFDLSHSRFSNNKIWKENTTLSLLALTVLESKFFVGRFRLEPHLLPEVTELYCSLFSVTWRY